MLADSNGCSWVILTRQSWFKHQRVLFFDKLIWIQISWPASPPELWLRPHLLTNYECEEMGVALTRTVPSVCFPGTFCWTLWAGRRCGKQEVSGEVQKRAVPGDEPGSRDRRRLLYCDEAAVKESFPPTLPSLLPSLLSEGRVFAKCWSCLFLFSIPQNSRQRGEKLMFASPEPHVTSTVKKGPTLFSSQPAKLSEPTDSCVPSFLWLILDISFLFPAVEKQNCDGMSWCVWALCVISQFFSLPYREWKHRM